jgi:hypothetical protein
MRCEKFIYKFLNIYGAIGTRRFVTEEVVSIIRWEKFREMFHYQPMRCETSEEKNNKIRQSYYRAAVVLGCSRPLWAYLSPPRKICFRKRWQETSSAYLVGCVGDLQLWISTKTNNHHREFETGRSRKAMEGFLWSGSDYSWGRRICLEIRSPSFLEETLTMFSRGHTDSSILLLQLFGMIVVMSVYHSS